MKRATKKLLIEHMVDKKGNDSIRYTYVRKLNSAIQI